MVNEISHPNVLIVPLEGFFIFPLNPSYYVVYSSRYLDLTCAVNQKWAPGLFAQSWPERELWFTSGVIQM